MRVPAFISALLFINLITSCVQKTKDESHKVKTKEVTSYDYPVNEEVEPPPPDIPSRFKNLQD